MTIHMNNNDYMKYDVIIIGAGVSGLYCARYLPKKLKVLILCKDQVWECNTFYAQGGISVARDLKDINLHIKDTLNAGCGINNTKAVELLSKESREIIKDLINGGFKIDKDNYGNISFTKEGGHSISRIIHSNGDGTGRVLHTYLISNLHHILWENANVIDLLIEDNIAYGVCVATKKGIINLYADNIVIASGGVGGLFKNNTNAHTINGDLHGIILEHNLHIKDMEMLQFHPTVYVETNNERKLLISEAIRGEGGIIVDEDGNRFLFEYDKRGELAPRDIVSRAIFDYEKKYNKRVYIDLNAFRKIDFKERFPNIYRQLTSCGFNIPKNKIPISPSLHYTMGGIEVELDSRVKGMINLYAIGECANNGIHGANRLASNSLLEGLVFGKIAAESILINKFNNKYKQFLINKYSLHQNEDDKLMHNLRNIMCNKVGIIRSKNNLKNALNEVHSMMSNNTGRILKLRLLVAEAIIKQALNRKDSLGAHYIIK